MKWSELPIEFQELEEKGIDLDVVYEFVYKRYPNSISKIQENPKDEKLELLKEIDEYYGRKENQKSMPLWLAVRIEKVINHNKTN